MAKKLSGLRSVQERAQAAVRSVNGLVDEMGQRTGSLYEAITDIQALFDRIRNVPEENWLKYEAVKGIRLGWKQQVESIEQSYKRAEIGTFGSGAAGVGAGVAVAAAGPTLAMGIATTFGVASTGTAISSLSGAAAAHAALAWLGGGALAAGGGGMAAGNALLALAGPVGLTIAALSLTASGLLLFKSKSERSRVEAIYERIGERDAAACELAMVEMHERIQRIEDEAGLLAQALEEIRDFGEDYRAMTEEQQYKLGAYVNLMEAAAMLLVNPIRGLQPQFIEQDFEMLCAAEADGYRRYYAAHRNMVLSLANLLYRIKLDDKERGLLAKSLRKNREFLVSINMTEKEFDSDDIANAERALAFRYSLRA